MGETVLPVKEDGTPDMSKCPVDDCPETEDLWLMECAPRFTWVYVNGCGHWGFIHRKVETET